MTNQQTEHHQQMKSDIYEHPEEMKSALSVLQEEMKTYKTEIMSGSLSLNKEAVQRLKEATEDLRNQHTATIEDVTYHTERLQLTREQLTTSKEEG